MTDTVIVVPTYWTWGRERSDGPVGAVFDHPTSVDGESTLPRLLNSLCEMVGPPFAMLVLTATVHPALEQAAEQRVTEIIAPFHERFPIVQFAPSDLVVLHGRMRDLLQSEIVSLLSLSSYPGVRNCQLVIPHVLGIEVIIALDDDEVVAPDYLETARRFVGREVGVEELIDEVERDRPFYGETGGGVTFSGGEPLAQGQFLLESLAECGRRGIHVAVDTCGFASRELVLRVSELTNLFLYDLKILDAKKLEELTGVPLRPILDNLRAIDGSGAEVVVRFPLITGVTDGARNLKALGDFLTSLKNTRRVHVLSFHKTAADKYARLGRRWEYSGLEPAPGEQVDGIIESFRGSGLIATAGGWDYDG